jgi:hypothetical protein
MSHYDKFLKELESTLVTDMANILNIPRDYSLESLMLLENRLNLIFEIERNPQLPTVLFIGFYLGEALVRNSKGASWKTDDCSDFYDICVEVPSKVDKNQRIVLYPFRRAAKFLKNPQYSLVAVFKAVCTLQKMQKKELKNAVENKYKHKV